MGYNILGREIEELVTEVTEGYLTEEEFSDAFVIQQRMDARKAQDHYNGDSDYKPEIQQLESFSDTRPSNWDVGIGELVEEGTIDVFDLHKRPNNRKTTEEKFYERIVQSPENGFLVDDNIWHDLFNEPSRTVGVTIDRDIWGFIENNYSDSGRFNPKLDQEGRVECTTYFTNEDILDFLQKSMENDRALTYASGLEDRLKNYWDSEVVDNFMDMVEPIADPVDATPVGSSDYPVDAGIAEVANREDLDIVTYDSDFLEESDEIFIDGQEVYTPHQAKEMI